MMTFAHRWWPGPIARLALAGTVLGAVVLGAGLLADLAGHAHDDHELTAELPPRYARIVAEHQAAEAANPWHQVLIAGEALLIGGLGTLYLTERASRRQDQRAAARRVAADPAPPAEVRPSAAAAH